MKYSPSFSPQKVLQDDTDTTNRSAKHGGAWKLVNMAEQPERLRALCQVVKSSFVALERVRGAKKSRLCKRSIFCSISSFQIHLLLAFVMVKSCLIALSYALSCFPCCQIYHTWLSDLYLWLDVFIG
jgi:hypothetical protein